MFVKVRYDEIVNSKLHQNDERKVGQKKWITFILFQKFKQVNISRPFGLGFEKKKDSFVTEQFINVLGMSIAGS